MATSWSMTDADFLSVTCHRNKESELMGSLRGQRKSGVGGSQWSEVKLGGSLFYLLLRAILYRQICFLLWAPELALARQSRKTALYWVLQVNICKMLPLIRTDATGGTSASFCTSYTACPGPFEWRRLTPGSWKVAQ